MQQWAGQVEDAQRPILLSARDGKLLRPVPHEQRLVSDKLAKQLEAALHQQHSGLLAQARRMLSQAWVRGGRSAQLSDRQRGGACCMVHAATCAVRAQGSGRAVLRWR